MLDRILNAFGLERRSFADSIPDERLAPSNFGFAHTYGGAVTPRSVMSNSAVAVACIRMRSELSAQVPLNLFRKLPDGSREVVTDNPLADVLNDVASPLLTAYELREFIARSLDLYGNAYALIIRNGAGQVVELQPIPATSVSVERLENGRLRYRYTLPSGKAGVALMSEMLHIRASTDDTLLGVSPISRARATLGLQINLAETAGTYAARGFRPGAYAVHPGKLSPKASNNLRDLIERDVIGPENAGRLLILEEGVDIKSAAFTAADAQILQSRELSNKDVALIFGVPGACLGLSDSVAYGSAQQASADLVANALHPLCVRIEQAMARCLLTPQGRKQYVIEHDLSGLLRADDVGRANVHKVYREIGVMSAEEIRNEENLGKKNPDQDYTPLRVSATPHDSIASVKP